MADGAATSLVDETIKRHVVPHAILRTTARFAFDLAQGSERGRYLHVISSNLAAAFTAEAYLNYAGTVLVKQAQTIAECGEAMDMASMLFVLRSRHDLVVVDDRAGDILSRHQGTAWPSLWCERDDPCQKLEKLRAFLGLPVVWGQRPLQSFKDLVKLRNDLVHAKPLELGPVTHTTREGTGWSQPDSILAPWERALGEGPNNSLDLEVTQRRLDDLGAIMAEVSNGIGMGELWTLGDREERSRSLSAKAPRQRKGG